VHVISNSRATVDVPFVAQLGIADCGIACLTMVLRAHQKKVTLREVHSACERSEGGISAFALARAGEHFGLEAEAYRVSREELSTVSLPAICHCTDNHYVVLASASQNSLEFLDPAFGNVRCALNAAYPSLSGVVLVFRGETSEASRTATSARAVHQVRVPVGLELVAECATSALPVALSLLAGRGLELAAAATVMILIRTLLMIRRDIAFHRAKVALQYEHYRRLARACAVSGLAGASPFHTPIAALAGLAEAMSGHAIVRIQLRSEFIALLAGFLALAAFSPPLALVLGIGFPAAFATGLATRSRAGYLWHLHDRASESASVATAADPEESEQRLRFDESLRWWRSARRRADRAATWKFWALSCSAVGGLWLVLHGSARGDAVATFVFLMTFSLSARRLERVEQLLSTVHRNQAQRARFTEHVFHDP
jgi:predicted double-glycine peptidase